MANCAAASTLAAPRSRRWSSTAQARCAARPARRRRRRWAARRGRCDGDGDARRRRRGRRPRPASSRGSGSGRRVTPTPRGISARDNLPAGRKLFPSPGAPAGPRLPGQGRGRRPVATEAEFRLGAGKPYRSILGVFSGTGVGGGSSSTAVPGPARQRGRDRAHGGRAGRWPLPLRAPRRLEAYAGRGAMEERARASTRRAPRPTSSRS